MVMLGGGGVWIQLGAKPVGYALHGMVKKNTLPGGLRGHFALVCVLTSRRKYYATQSITNFSNRGKGGITIIVGVIYLMKTEET